MVLQGGPCGRVDRRRTQFQITPLKGGVIFFQQLQRWKKAYKLLKSLVP